MFMGGQNFPGYWGRNFVGSVIGIILIYMKQMIVYTFVGMLSHEHWYTTNNDELKISLSFSELQGGDNILWKRILDKFASTLTFDHEI